MRDYHLILFPVTYRGRPSRIRADRPGGRFTLIELLVVIVVIAILASLLLPSLSQAKRTTKLALCSNNQRQIGYIVRLYADDYDATLPPTVSWFATPYVQQSQSTQLNYHADADSRRAVSRYLGDYVSDVRPFVCALGPPYREQWNIDFLAGDTSFLWASYSLLWQNSTIGPRRMTDDPDLLLICDALNQSFVEVLAGHDLPGADGTASGYGAVWAYAPGTPAVGTRMNAAFFDGHVAGYDVAAFSRSLGIFEYGPTDGAP